MKTKKMILALVMLTGVGLSQADDDTQMAMLLHQQAGLLPSFLSNQNPVRSDEQVHAAITSHNQTDTSDTESGIHVWELLLGVIVFLGLLFASKQVDRKDQEDSQ